MDSDGSPPGVLCILCKTDDENKITGPLLSKDGTSAHENCLMYSSGIYSKSTPDFDDLGGFHVEDVIMEHNRGKKLKCYHCKKTGATVGCENKKCKRSYHYPCAIKDHAKRVKDKSEGTYWVYCPIHTPDHLRNSNLANESNSSPANVNSSARKKLRVDDSSGETSSGSDSVRTPSRLRKKKRGVELILSNSDESVVEETVPQKKHKSTPVPENERNREEPVLIPHEDSNDSIQMMPPLEDSDVEETVLEEQHNSDSVGTPAWFKSIRKTCEVVISDLGCLPLEDSNGEETRPKKQQKKSTPVPEDERNLNREEPIPSPPDATIQIADGDETDIEEEMQTTGESQSLLETEYQNESVPFTVISDSGTFSFDSENSIGPITSPSHLPGPSSSAGPPVGNHHGSRILSAPIVTTPQINPLEPPCPAVDSPPLEGASAAEPVESPNLVSALAPPCGESDNDMHPEPPARPSSRNIIPDLPESHAPPKNAPLDLTASSGSSTASRQPGEEVQKILSTSETGAALFWRRCNEVGCTESIFSELTNQISCLAERVQSQHATQQEYGVSLRILEASGKLPAIFQQLDQDFEERERELKRKREALNEARALLNHYN